MSLNTCHFKTTTPYSHGFIVEECAIANFSEEKTSDSFSNFTNSSHIKLTA